MAEEVKCATCGKIFRKAPQHALIDGNKAYCKPTCFLHRHDKKKKKGGVGQPPRRVAKYTEDGELVKAYSSAKEAEELDGYDAKYVRRCINEGRVYKGFFWKYLD